MYSLTRENCSTQNNIAKQRGLDKNIHKINDTKIRHKLDINILTVFIMLIIIIAEV